MGYYLAPALVVLRAEINARWPRRDKTSDGWIGDAAHRAGKSDHNPNARGSVNAIDVDKDGVNMAEIIDAFERHPSAHYWIFNRQIADRDEGWRRRPYGGSNPHDKHGHFSIRQSKAAEQDRRPWGVQEEDEMDAKQFLAILRDPAVAAQMRAFPWQYIGGGIPDGMSALKVFAETHAAAKMAAVAAGVDEQAIIAGVLAGLSPEQIAAAIPPTFAGQVVDLLAARMRD